MKPEIRDQWADAMESDEFTQGIKRLTTVEEDGTEKDCCLGVLCKLAVKAGVIPEGEIVYEGTYDVNQRAYGTGRSTGLLPREVTEWAGLPPAPAEHEEGGSVMLDLNGRSLNADYLNDGLRLSFKEIAKLVREQL